MIERAICEPYPHLFHVWIIPKLMCTKDLPIKLLNTYHTVKVSDDQCLCVFV